MRLNNIINRTCRIFSGRMTICRANATIPESPVLPKNINLSLEKIQPGNKKDFDIFKNRLLKALPNQEKFIQSILFLEDGINKHSPKFCTEIIQKMKDSENGMSLTGYLMLISLRESIEYWAKCDFGLPILQNTELEEIEDLITKHYDFSIKEGINYFDAARIERVRGQFKENLDFNFIREQLNSKRTNQGANTDESFCDLISVLDFYFHLKSEHKPEIVCFVQDLIISKLPYLRKSALIKFLTFSDFTDSLLFTENLLFLVENKIFNSMNDDQDNIFTLKLIHFLSENNLVFRQQLLLQLKQFITNPLSLSPEFFFKYVFLMKTNDIQLKFPPLEIAHKVKSLNLEKCQVDFLIIIKYLIIELYIDNSDFNHSWNEQIKKINLESLPKATLLRLYTLCFYANDMEIVTKLKWKLIDYKNIDYDFLKVVLTDIFSNCQNPQGYEGKYKDQFGFLVELFIEHMIRSDIMEADEKSYWRDQIAKSTDLYDFKLKKIKVN